MEKRLFRQYDSLVTAMQRKRTVVLKHLATNRNEEIGFGRFLRNPRVPLQALLRQITQPLTQRVAGKSILLIEDTTQLGFGLQSAIKGIGKAATGTADGFYSHPVLVLDAAAKHCYGLAHCHVFNQNHALKEAGFDLPTRRRLTAQIPFEHKDSYRWVESIQQAHQVCQPAQAMTVIADREADIYQALYAFKEELGIDFLIRMRVDRPVVTDLKGQTITDCLAHTPLGYSYQVALPATDKRSKHRAKLEVKWTEVQLKRPPNKTLKALPRSLTVRVVEVTETPATVVNGEAPVHWILLTSHAVATPEEASQLITWYSWRWFIEQLFRLLKSEGLDILGSSLSTYESLSKVSLLALEAAVRVLQLLIARDSELEVGVESAFSGEEVGFLQTLSPTLEGATDKLKNPYPAGDLKFALWVVARLGGWSGYAKQTRPGAITLHRGLLKFHQLMEGFRLAQSIHQRGG
jgi:hypothetical protein